MFLFFKQKTAYEMRISDWSSDVCSSDLKKRISYVEEGSFLAKMLNVPIDVKGRLSPKDTTKFLRLGRHKQSNTLRCGEIFFHPTEERYLKIGRASCRDSVCQYV